MEEFMPSEGDEPVPEEYQNPSEADPPEPVDSSPADMNEPETVDTGIISSDDSRVAPVSPIHNLGHISPESTNPTTDNEIGVRRFMSMDPTTQELSMATAIALRERQVTAREHRDFIDHAKDAGGQWLKRLDLQTITPRGTATIQITETSERLTGSVRVTFEPLLGNPSTHTYYHTADGRFIGRFDHSNTAPDVTLPKPGLLPAKLLLQLEREARLAELQQLPNADIHKDSPPANHRLVGVAEMDYIWGLARAGQPVRIYLTDLKAIAENRFNTPLPPDNTDALEAADAFTQEVERFLDKRGLRTVWPRLRTAEMHVFDPGIGSMQIYAGKEQARGREPLRSSRLPYVRILPELPAEMPFLVLEYTVDDHGLKTVFYSTDGTPDRVVRGDMLEVWRVRNFLESMRQLAR